MTLRRQRLDIDLQANGQRCCRIDRRNDLVHSQHIGPQLLVAKGVEAEYRLSVLVTRGTLPFRRDGSLLCLSRGNESRNGERHREDEYD